MELEKGAIDSIVAQLKTKACLKQKNFGNIKKVFKTLKKEANDIVTDLNEKIGDLESIELAVKEINESEFHIKFSGDLLVFIMQTNIITFPPEYTVMQSDYIREDKFRGYFGNIMIYNFMADTLRYNRMDDPGYLIARLLVNHENHFYVEGVRQLNFLFTDITHNVLSKEWLRLLIEKCMSAAMDIDLIGTRYPEIAKVVRYEKINKNNLEGNSQKIGFQMNSDEAL